MSSDNEILSQLGNAGPCPRQCRQPGASPGPARPPAQCVVQTAGRYRSGGSEAMKAKEALTDQQNSHNHPSSPLCPCFRSI